MQRERGGMISRRFSQHNEWTRRRLWGGLCTAANYNFFTLSVRASQSYHSSPDRGEGSCVFCYSPSPITLIWHENSKQNHVYVLNVRSNNM